MQLLYPAEATAPAPAPASAGSTLSPVAPAPAPAPAGSKKVTITNSRNILRRLETGSSQGKATSSSELSFLQKLLQDSLILQQSRRIFC